jgi:hypothetical protein
MSASEKTSLLPSNASGSGPSYYFLKGEATGGASDLVRDADGGQVIEIVPDGATDEDFASRPVGQKVSRCACLRLHVTSRGSTNFLVLSIGCDSLPLLSVLLRPLQNKRFGKSCLVELGHLAMVVNMARLEL